MDEQSGWPQAGLWRPYSEHTESSQSHLRVTCSIDLVTQTTRVCRVTMYVARMSSDIPPKPHTPTNIVPSLPVASQPQPSASEAGLAFEASPPQAHDEETGLDP